MEFGSERIAYLQMIQGVIDRMSTKSGNVKGFCVVIAAGVTALTFKETEPISLLISFLMILIFLKLDMFYLGMERKYRYLYNEIRKGGNVDFNLVIDLKESEIQIAKSSFWECLKSKTTIGFYLPLGILMATILILKFKGVV